MEIPLRNVKGETIAKAIIDKEDYQYVRGRSWYRERVMQRVDGSYLDYARNSEKQFLHDLIIGGSKPGHVIDHIDNDGLNNRKSNLRHATLAQNSQNRAKTPGSVSRYIGLTFEAGKWRAKCAGNHLGRFDNEEAAAKAYDFAALQLFGQHASTNDFLSPEERTVALSTPFEKPTNPLPKGVEKSKNGSFSARIKSPEFGRESLGTFKTCDEAQAAYNKRFEELAKLRKQRHDDKPIERDQKTKSAVIYMRNQKKEVTGKLLMPDEDWHFLTGYTWYIQRNTVYTSIDRKIKNIKDVMLDNDKTWTGEVIKA